MIFFKVLIYSNFFSESLLAVLSFLFYILYKGVEESLLRKKGMLDERIKFIEFKSL